MAWTDPRDWSAGEVVTAAQMNTNVRDNTNFLRDEKVEVVEHGSDATVARPASPKTVLWVGSADPNNGNNNDLLVRDDLDRLFINATGTWMDITSMAAIDHGSTSGTARPAGLDVAYWVGTVDPTNARNDDLLLRTDESRVYVRQGSVWGPAGWDGSTANDLSDITTHTVTFTTSSSNTDLINVSGKGFLLGGIIQGYNINNVSLGIDGGSVNMTEVDSQDDAGNISTIVYLPPVFFTSSLVVNIKSDTSTTSIAGYAYTRTL